MFPALRSWPLRKARAHQLYISDRSPICIQFTAGLTLAMECIGCNYCYRWPAPWRATGAKIADFLIRFNYLTRMFGSVRLKRIGNSMRDPLRMVFLAKKSEYMGPCVKGGRESPFPSKKDGYRTALRPPTATMGRTDGFAHITYPWGQDRLGAFRGGPLTRKTA